MKFILLIAICLVFSYSVCQDNIDSTPSVDSNSTASSNATNSFPFSPIRGSRLNPKTRLVHDEYDFRGPGYNNNTASTSSNSTQGNVYSVLQSMRAQRLQSVPSNFLH